MKTIQYLFIINLLLIIFSKNNYAFPAFQQQNVNYEQDPSLNFFVEDGGSREKRLKGDKSKNQGYANYRNTFIFISSEVFSTPHQQAYESFDWTNQSYGFEYAFNPFLSVKYQKLNLNFESLQENDEYQHEHDIFILHLRLYLYNNVVVRLGYGFGTAKVETNKTFKGETQVFQTALFYIFGDENIMLGITQTIIAGKDQLNNLGLTTYGLAAGIGF